MNISWQYLNKHEATISAVKDYDSMKAIVSNMVWKKKCQRGCPTCQNCMKGFEEECDECSPAYSNKQKRDTKEVFCASEQRYKQALDFMEWFQPAWNALTEDEREVISLFFLTEQTNKTDAVYSVCDRFFIERSAAYKKKERAIYHLTVLLYGK